MANLIKNGDIILNGKKTREQLEKEAFTKLERIEKIMAQFGLDTPSDLRKALNNFVEVIDMIVKQATPTPLPPQQDNKA